MARIYAFSKDTCQEEFKLRAEALAPLDKKGLRAFAENTLEKIKQQKQYSDVKELSFPIVEDSYLYTFAKLEKTYAMANTRSAPDMAAKHVISDILPVIRNIKSYADDFFTKHDLDAQTSDSLYAAAIISFATPTSIINDTHVAIAGEKAAQILQKEKEIQKDAFSYYKTDTPAESKLLHLVYAKIQSDKYLRELEKGTPNKVTENAMSDFCEHISQLFLARDTSDIEEIILKRTSEIRKRVNDLKNGASPTDDAPQI